MIYKHKRTGDLYTVLMECFSVELQKPCVLYIGLKNGAIFTRNKEAFKTNFEFLCDYQADIIPKEPHE